MLKIAFLNAASELDKYNFHWEIVPWIERVLIIISCSYWLLVRHTLWSELSVNDLLVAV